MLCPVPPGSGSRTTNWLDRLRFNKGFSTDATSPESTRSTAPHRLTPAPPQTHNNNSNNDQNALINILSDLFNNGPHSNNNPSKKASRKQTNPKPLLVPRRNDQNALLATSTSSNDNNADSNVGDDDDGENESMKGFSKSEVTVIDTSCEVWKSDKLVFRKENVWRVREKKGRSGPWKGRKRKRSEGEKLGFGDKKREKGSGSCSLELSEVCF